MVDIGGDGRLVDGVGSAMEGTMVMPIGVVVWARSRLKYGFGEESGVRVHWGRRYFFFFLNDEKNKCRKRKNR